MLPVEIIVGIVLIVIAIFIAIFFLNQSKNNNTTAVTNKPMDKIDKVDKVKKIQKVQKKYETPAETVRIDTSSYNRSPTAKVGGEYIRHHAKNPSVHGNTDPLNDEVSQFQTASTILSNTYLMENEEKEKKYFEKLMIELHQIFDHLHVQDIKNFCKQYKVSSVKRGEHGASKIVNLEINEDQSCIDSNLWMVAYKGSEQYRIFPGTIIHDSFKALSTENARLVREIFGGIMLIIPGNKLTVIEPAIAEKRNDVLVITRLGKLGVPLETNKR